MSGEPASAGPETDQAATGRDFDVFRWRLGDAIAVLAAFALLFIMAGDWYSTRTGEEAREIVNRQGTEEPGAGLFDDGAVADARVEAEQAERNAWQISSPLDLLVLLALLATIALTLAAAALRAAGRVYRDLQRSPSAIAAAAALATLLLLAIQAGARLDPDSDVTVQIGLPLAVGALGMIACGTGLALRDDRDAEAAASPGESGETPVTGRGAKAREA